MEGPRLDGRVRPAPSNAPKTSDGKPMLMKRKLGCPAKKVADDVKPTTETRPPLSVQDELDPPAKKTRGRLRKQPVEQKAEAPLAEGVAARRNFPAVLEEELEVVSWHCTSEAKSLRYRR